MTCHHRRGSWCSIARLVIIAVIIEGTGTRIAHSVDDTSKQAVGNAGEDRDVRLMPRSLLDPVDVADAPAAIDPQSRAPNALCATTFLPTDGTTSGNGRAPSVRYRGIKNVYLITAAELAAGGLSPGVSPTGIGWHYSTAPGNVGAGALTIYLQNTSDTTFTKSTSFAAAVVGMTVVHSAMTTLPNSTAPFDIPFSGGSPFTYTGGGLYVGFEWTYTGTLSATAVVACNAALTNGMESSQSTSGAASDALVPSNFRPETRLTVTIGDDLAVDYVITLGELPKNLVAPQAVRAVVTNRGNARTNVPVTLHITGAEAFTDTQVVPALAACGGQTTVSFAPFSAGVLGADQVAVSAPADDFPANDARSRPLAVTVNTYSYKHPGTSAVPGGLGFTGSTGEFVAKFTVTSATQVDALKLEFMTAGGSYRVVVYGDSGSGTPGAQLYVDAADRVATAGLVTVRFPVPVPVGPGSFFAGVQQTGQANFAYSFDAEAPVRSGTFFFSTSLNEGPWTDFAPGRNFKLNVGLIIGSCLVPLSNNVTPNAASTCAGNPLSFTSTAAGGTGQRTYQWTENGSDIVAQTGPILSVTKGAAGSFSYNCKVTDDGGCIDVVDGAASAGTWIGSGSACDDGNSCTSPDTCAGSVCSGPNPCNDGNACTVDLCSPTCSYLPVSCDDGNPCTSDTCHVVTGCAHSNNTASCTDGNFCTVGDACSGGSCVPGALPSFVQFCNSGVITINDVSPPTLAAPYPSSISVSGQPPQTCSVRVNLNGVTHVFPDDIDVLLAGPGSQNAIIMSDVGGGSSASGVNLILDDQASTTVPDAGPLVAGTFKPTNVNPGTGTEAWPAPAPAPLGTSVLSAFAGSNPNGNWNLYVVDDEQGDAGSITGGWCVSIAAVCAPPAETTDLAFSSKIALVWTIATGATTSDVVRGTLSALPVGPGGADEVCVAGDAPGNTAPDTFVPPLGAGVWYLVRGGNSCGAGSYGNAVTYPGVVLTPRVTVTCP